MKPPHRNRRLAIVAISGIFIFGGAALVLSALKDNTQFFHNPSGVVAPGFTAKSAQIRIGGIVELGSVEKGEGLITTFAVHDFENMTGQPDRLLASHDGVLPDLFREGEGVVMTGALNAQGVFIADEVLAKHDNNYRPKLPETGS